VARFEELLGVSGRVTNEGWVEQAIFLIGGAPPAPEPEVFEAEPAVSPILPGGSVAPGPAVPASAPRGESYAGLRSVRSEALRGEGAGGVTSGEIEDLKRIRGIGVLIEKKLNSLGITAYEQVANWTRADIDRISQVLDFKGRIERENWIEQARILASGGQTEFSRRADRGEA
jgi:predicted flap endonuclease-1-like 5' DNA nuclease